MPPTLDEDWHKLEFWFVTISSTSLCVAQWNSSLIAWKIFGETLHWRVLIKRFNLYGINMTSKINIKMKYKVKYTVFLKIHSIGCWAFCVAHRFTLWATLGKCVSQNCRFPFFTYSFVTAWEGSVWNSRCVSECPYNWLVSGTSKSGAEFQSFNTCFTTVTNVGQNIRLF